MLPKDHKMPKNWRSARSYVTALGMDYHKIHACVNDCMLFYNNRAYATHCAVCKEPRYKDGMQGTSVPCKVLRHFPIIQSNTCLRVGVFPNLLHGMQAIDQVME